MGDVVTTKGFENETNILWKFTLEPGEETPFHAHSHDYVFHVLDSAPFEVHDSDGADLATFNATTGSTFALKLDGNDLVSTNDKNHCVTANRKAKSTGGKSYREILVETN